MALSGMWDEMCGGSSSFGGGSKKADLESQLHLPLTEDTEILSGDIGEKRKVVANTAIFIDAIGSVGCLASDEVIVLGDSAVTIGHADLEQLIIWGKSVHVRGGSIKTLISACDTLELTSVSVGKHHIYGRDGKDYDWKSVAASLKERLNEMSEEVENDDDYDDVVIPTQFTAKNYGYAEAYSIIIDTEDEAPVNVLASLQDVANLLTTPTSKDIAVAMAGLVDEDLRDGLITFITRGDTSDFASTVEDMDEDTVADTMERFITALRKAVVGDKRVFKNSDEQG